MMVKGQSKGKEKPIAIVLGGTVPHKYLIENLKGRGYRTFLIDYYENPPAAAVADVHVRESTLDQEKVLEIAKQEKASLVISGCVDQANITACYVAEKLGLPAPYSYETALRVTDKTLMKESLINSEVPTAAYQVITAEEVDTFQCNDYPRVVKPCDCNGSKGVRKVNSQVELTQALEEACNLSRTGKAIVEDYNEGIEVNGYFFIRKNAVNEIYIKSKTLPHDSGQSSLQSFISIGPEPITEKARANFRQAVEKIAAEFGLKNTPILVQANIDGDSVKVIEFAPRVGGGLAFREIKILTGFDLLDAVTDSYLGKHIDTSFIKVPDGMVSVVHLYGRNGTLDYVLGMDYLISEGVVEEFHFHKTSGMRVNDQDLASSNRIMGAIIRARSMNELDYKINRMISGLQVLSKDGVDILRRDLFKSLSF